MSKTAEKKEIETSNVLRQDFENNHSKICESFKKLAKELNKVPTYEEMSSDTGLHRDTIYRHFRDYKFTDRVQKFKALTDDVLASLYKMATVGKSHRAADLFMKHIEGRGDKLQIDVNLKDKVTGFHYVTPDQIQEAEIIEDEPEDD